MNSKWRNFFFIFGIAATLLMLLTFDSSWDQVRQMLSKAGLWFPLILLLWLVIYIMNASAWQMILRAPGVKRVPFLKVLKVTITGFALNYTTPLGLMGGEPYRVMEMAPHVGTSRATSSVLLYAMMHIASHFAFWLLSVVLYVVMHFAGVEHCVLNGVICSLLTLLTVVFVLGLWLFERGFRYGFVVKVFGLLCHIPLIKGWANAFLERQKEILLQIDQEISSMHGVSNLKFWGSFVLELLGRMLSCIEYWVLLRLLMPEVSYLDSVLIMAFSSFFSNLLFFMPMQIGGREGGLAMASAGLSIPAEYGLYTSLASRVREFVWVVIGIGLMKIGNGNGRNSH